MAAVSSVKFDSLLKNSPDFYGCKSHMAVFVMTQGGHYKGLIKHQLRLHGFLLLPLSRSLPIDKLDMRGRRFASYKVVALGAGRSYCRKWLCSDGTMVHDCQAIVIARRALLRYHLWPVQSLNTSFIFFSFLFSKTNNNGT